MSPRNPEVGVPSRNVPRHAAVERRLDMIGEYALAGYHAGRAWALDEASFNRLEAFSELATEWWYQDPDSEAYRLGEPSIAQECWALIPQTCRADRIMFCEGWLLGVQEEWLAVSDRIVPEALARRVIHLEEELGQTLINSGAALWAADPRLARDVARVAPLVGLEWARRVARND